MTTPRHSLSFLVIGLSVGFLGGYLFRSVTSVSETRSPQQLTQGLATGFTQLNRGSSNSGKSLLIADATAWAVSLANDAAQAAYGTALFTAKGEAASFDGRRWTWKQRVACGTGDLEAEVWLSPNGMVEKLDVQLLVNVSVRDF